MTRSIKNRVGLIVVLGVIATAIAIVCWPDPQVDNHEVSPVTPELDEQYRELIIGTWQDDYKGRRTLTVCGDGTATMVVEPDGLNAVFAARLTFYEEWSIVAGHLKQKAIGGEPEARANLILKMMGDESNQKIIELTRERMLLQDADGKTRYDWRPAGKE